MTMTPEETWAPVLGAEGRYEVSDHGRVRSLPHTVVRSDGQLQPVKGRTLKPFITHSGGRRKPYRYRAVRIRINDGRCRNRKISVLMLEAFVGPRPFLEAQARHLNDHSLDDRLENLAWGSQTDNQDDARRNGRMSNRRGATGSAVLTETDVVAARAAYAAGGVFHRELAAQYGVDPSTIGYAVTGKTWQHVQQVGLTSQGSLTAEAATDD